MRLTPRQLNRATLARQLLLRRERLSVVEGLRRVTALQAQEPASPYVALWNRLADFDPRALDAAFEGGEVVKATLMRITLHAVLADDYGAFHAAMLPNLRASRLGDARFTASGLTAADADELLSHVLELAGRPCSPAEIEALLAERLGAPPDRGVWWALRTFAPLVHVPTGGPWAFGTARAFRAGPTTPDLGGHGAALGSLVRRYLEAFGPASVADIAQFTLQKRSLVRVAVRALGEQLVAREGPGGGELFDLPGASIPDDDVPAPPRLMAMWDSTLLAYADRARVIPDAYRPHVIRRNGDVLPTLLVDGYVAGVWRPVAEGIEAQAFHALDEATWDELEGEAHVLRSLLAERDPTAYRRYGHWWGKLSGVQARVLAS